MKFPFEGRELYIDGYLANSLNTIAYNIKNDWDFVLMITGDRTVRVGKSVLAATICAYLSYAMQQLGFPTKYSLDDVYFDNKTMMEAAFKKPQYSINQYDEGREGLASSKWASQLQQDLLDFFAECGQLNQIFVIVAPDFFGLKEDIAVARSECLINVYRKENKKIIDIKGIGTQLPVVKLERGFFEFFNKKSKQKLYDMARSTKRKSYGITKAEFIGRFTNQYPFSEEAYRNKKREALSRFQERKKEEVTSRDKKMNERMRLTTINLREKGFKWCEIGEIIGVHEGTAKKYGKVTEI